MSIFDSIQSSITELGKDIFGDDAVDFITDNKDDILSLGKSATRAAGYTDLAMQKRAAKQDSLEATLNKYTSRMPIDQKYQAHEAGYGLKNYSANPEEINSKWSQILQGYVTANINPQSGVNSKYRG